MKRKYKQFSDIPLLDIPESDEKEDLPAPVGFGFSGDENAEVTEVPVTEPKPPEGERFMVLEAKDITGPARSGPELRAGSSASAVVAERFLELVTQGTIREEAALEISGLPYTVFKGRKDVVACVEALMDTYHLDPEVRQKTRAGFLNKLMLEGAVTDDPMAKKLALDAAKQIQADSGVVDTNINVNLGDLKKFLE